MKKPTAIAAIAIAGSLAAAATAEPPEGRGWKKHHRHDRYERKEEFWDGNCKVERKWSRNGDYKEERKCEGGRGREYAHREPAGRVVVELPPWFDRGARQPEYEPEWRPAPSPSSTRCNSKEVGRVLGGLIGGVLGHQVGDGRGQTAATIGGAIAGVLIGGKIGDRMDARNQACVAQALEFAPEGQRISWQDGGRQYAVTPGAIEQRGGSYCRSFTAELGGDQRTRGTACRRADGTWVKSR
ncbi:glycine zipper 2TM domain-containing protein [Microbulbifer halophilus]|uniref:Glycine zipper 2TM domain-containing protein n=1 Tax=Microbulbifer halophilus TaxID=453963 RepID=A0ABW5EE91_9GAMM|nr:glycine zipper 2TM domain-containing protein [Microbulbifer halophilus]MCW8127031.1 glycine zipper 2TM domain-containing protein [Microbulbifer halophilus]